MALSTTPTTVTDFEKLLPPTPSNVTRWPERTPASEAITGLITISSALDGSALRPSSTRPRCTDRISRSSVAAKAPPSGTPGSVTATYTKLAASMTPGMAASSSATSGSGREGIDTKASSARVSARNRSHAVAVRRAPRNAVTAKAPANPASTVRTTTARHRRLRSTVAHSHDAFTPAAFPVRRYRTSNSPMLMGPRRWARP